MLRRWRGARPRPRPRASPRASAGSAAGRAAPRGVAQTPGCAPSASGPPCDAAGAPALGYGSARGSAAAAAAAGDSQQGLRAPRAGPRRRPLDCAGETAASPVEGPPGVAGRWPRGWVGGSTTGDARQTAVGADPRSRGRLWIAAIAKQGRGAELRSSAGQHVAAGPPAGPLHPDQRPDPALPSTS